MFLFSTRMKRGRLKEAALTAERWAAFEAAELVKHAAEDKAGALSPGELAEAESNLRRAWVRSADQGLSHK
jgi:hypothetical protein